MPVYYILLLAGLTTTLFVWSLGGRQSVNARFFRYAGVDALGDRPQRDLPAWLLSFAPMLERTMPNSYLTRTRFRLRMAGLLAVAHFQLFVTVQVSLVLLGASAGLLGGHANALALAAAGACVGGFAPAAWLSRRIRVRQQAIAAVLPDTVDMLTACVEAGLGLDGAIAQLVRRRSKACWAINQELGRYLQEIQRGESRTEALRNLSTRSGLEDLRGVVGALMQGDALGVGVGQVLRAQAEHLRLRRKQQAEERAMKAPIKILFPLVFGIFPAIFVVLLGPAALRLVDTLVGKV